MKEIKFMDLHYHVNPDLYLRCHNAIEVGEKYKKLSNSGLDMLDSKSTAYHNRCISLVDPKTGKDATVSFRRKNYYQNKTAECAPGCDYGGLDEKGYVTCECEGMMESEQRANSMYLRDSV